MADFIFHNTLTGEKEKFTPLKKGHVSLYVCGITPYDEVHLGHARCYVVFDIVKRVLRHQGYKVNHIQNFTDVDDKIIERAFKKGESPLTYPKTFIEQYHHWMQLLNVEPADVYPLVTENMDMIQSLVQKLIDRQIAYVKEGDVYFSVRMFPLYGQLSKRNIDELEAGARVEVDDKKKDALDFALWKKAKESEPSWESPWGRGRPGWHIECSALSMKHLGETFDIHGGGQDLIFPHHENEIAQANAATGQSRGFARYWIHNGFVTINKEKMSKSLGNFFTVREIVSRYTPMAVRYFLLTQHYRSPLNFSDADLNVAETTWKERIIGAYEALTDLGQGMKENLPSKKEGNQEWGKIEEEFYDCLRNDFNTPAALGILNQFCTRIFQAKEHSENERPNVDWAEEQNRYKRMLDVLGLRIPEEETWSPDILGLVQKREEARRNKDWHRADEIRDELAKQKVLVKDTPHGPKLGRI